MSKLQNSSKKARKVIKEIESQNLWMVVGPQKGKVLADEVKKKKTKQDFGIR